MPRVIQVIECDVTRGAGNAGDPSRTVVQYYTLDGQLLAERDHWVELQAAEARQRADTRPMGVAR